MKTLRNFWTNSMLFLRKDQATVRRKAGNTIDDCMKKNRFVVFIILMCTACAPSGNGEQGMPEIDSAAIRELQGVWLDDNTELPLFRIKGDSIYYASQINVPMPFTVRNDTLMVQSVVPINYPIEERGMYFLRYRTLAGDVVSLHKAESDTLSFGTPADVPETTDKVTSKDSVIMYGGERFRGYAYINPTRMKVIRMGVSEEGLPVENIYFDNIIHICIYKGRECLFARDINKKMFSGVVPDDFLQTAILSDMDFMAVNEAGFWYQATICVPDETSCYNVKLNISREGEIKYSVQ